MATQRIALTTTNRLQAFFDSPVRLSIAYVGMLALAELVTAYVHAAVGAGIHAALLVALLIHAASISENVSYPLLISLIIAPLIRLLSLALPLFLIDQKYWYFVISVPLFAACVFCMRLLRFSAYEVGFNLRHLPYQLITAFLGIGFGYIEFSILRPEPLVKDVTALNMLIASISLLIGTGLLEELAFRGIMQRAAEKALGVKGSLLFSAIVFTVLHLGWQSAIDLAFVFIAGLWWGIVFHRTGSILGITLSHTFTNIMLFILLPLALPNDLRPQPIAPGISNVTSVAESEPEAPFAIVNPEQGTVTAETAISTTESSSMRSEDVVLLVIIEIYLLLVCVMTLMAVVRRRRKRDKMQAGVVLDKQ
jgi:membrane protease YdiL (CAAX protease family)